MINTFILAGIVISTILLSAVTSKQIMTSIYFTHEEKKRIILFIWLLPIIGSLKAVSKLREGAMQHKEKMEQAMIDQLNQLTAKIDGMRHEVEKKHKKKLH